MTTLPAANLNSSSGPSVARPSSSSKWIDVLILLPFLAFYLFQIAHHQMWRDELNAWGIAAGSSNPKQLYQHIRYEGHPSLWYAMLWVLSRFSTSPVLMQCLQALIGTAIYLMIAFRSPFSRLEKVLLYAGYFVSFEYTVMSRMYGVAFLLALVYADRRSRHPERVISNFVLLALLANTDVTGLILSGVLAVEYLARIYLARPVSDRPTHRDLGEVAKALAIYAFGALTCYLALRISPHISWRTTGRMFVAARNPMHLLQAIISYVSVPWFPIDRGFPHHFWNPWIDVPGEHRLLLLAAPCIAAAVIFIFRRDASLFSIWFLTTCGAIIFAHLVYMGGTRHQGVTFVAFLVAYWLLRYRDSYRPVLGLLLLGVGAIGGVLAGYALLEHPFSNGEAAVRWLRQNHMADLPLVGTPDTSVIGVAEQLRRPIYMLDCNCSNTFLLFNNQRDDFRPEETPERLKLAADKMPADKLVLLTTYPLPPERIDAIRTEGFSIDLLARFTRAEDYEENYFIYNVKR